MIIQLPEWDGWRIEGADLDWQIQKAVHRKSGDTWEGTNFYPSLEAAIGAVYERTLRESPKTAVDIREVLAECEKVKLQLVKAVRKTVAS